MNTRRRFIAAAAASGALAAAGAWKALAAAPEARVIKVVARRFVYQPAVLTLKRGEPVVLEFTSADVVMGFNAPDFNVRTDIIPGQVSRLRFTPDKVGRFTFLCDVFCGDGHEGMTGELHVVA
jgi:cytochrome c oxidase subunit 2